ncbi:Thioesterase/thiol ester dehydrase-isomerase [Xylariaceae sp. FL0662B]|nr:Thioesterase/thiol ester dehydrase-isomerase [Xylariaceae sp. FL0662B]
MPAYALVESHVAVTAVADFKDDVYTNTYPLSSHDGARSVFGDGRAYATRVVRAFQVGDDRCVYVAIISFQNYVVPAGNVLEYVLPRPDLGGIRPDAITSQKVQQQMDDTVSKSVPLLQRDAKKALPPFDWRPLELNLVDEPTQFLQHGFVRSQPLSTDSDAVNLASLGYLSDDYFLGPPMYANAKAVGVGLRNVAMGGSLTHNVSFHDSTTKADEWMLCERNTTWGTDGRTLSHQRFWNWKTGRLVMTCSQEALFRLKAKAGEKL